MLNTRGIEMKFNHTQESGRSMVEMLGVLAIVGVLSVGGIAGYSQAMAKFKVTKTMDQVQTIITNMRTLYASSRTYSNVTPETAYKVGILTDETYDSTSKKGVNPFGGEISFGNTTRTFSVTYTNFTPEACVKIATAEWGADESSGLVSMKIGTNEHKWASQGATTAATLLPIDVATAISQCGTNSAATSVTWEYR